MSSTNNGGKEGERWWGVPKRIMVASAWELDTAHNGDSICKAALQGHMFTLIYMYMCIIILD